MQRTMSNNVDNIQITKEQTLFKMLKDHEIVLPKVNLDFFRKAYKVN